MSIFTDGGCWCYECPNILKPNEKNFCSRCLSYGVKEGVETPELLKKAIKYTQPSKVSLWLSSHFPVAAREVKFESRYRRNCKVPYCYGHNKKNSVICIECVLHNDRNNLCVVCKQRGTHKVGDICASPCHSPEEKRNLEENRDTGFLKKSSEIKSEAAPSYKAGSWIDNEVVTARKPHIWME